ncbi:MAG: response regulator, partial [Actinomycetota bacterium]|nr:response regulator [Actinomycetota bacterium]
TSMGSGAEKARGAPIAATLTKPLKQSQLYDTLVGVMAEQPSRPEPAPTAIFDPGMAERLPMRILLVEDNPINQKLTLHMLSKYGYRADVAANGVEAVDAVARQPYDVVFMDVQMPVMDGCEATRRIRRRFPSGPRIIAMTANALEGDREDCLAAGMDDYMSKPISPHGLKAALSRTVAQTPVLDGAVVDRLLDVVGEDGPALVDEFLTDATALAAAMKQALDDGTPAELHRAAHTLKSTALTFGATALAEVCGQLERFGKDGPLGEAPGLVRHVTVELDRLTAALRDRIDL